ncbi:MAG: hypothetical protein OXL40_01625 [Bacteroidota bacterium]|nr:hypothetical protein [Bacteroidota bacterium]
MMHLRWVVLLTLGLLSAGISATNDCDQAARSASGPTIGLNAAGPSVTVDVACHFTSATSSETFTVSSTDPLTVAASLTGTLLTLDPGHVGNATPGTATVTVTRGSESYAIDVVVSSCLTAADAALLPRFVVYKHQVMTWDLDMSDHFVKTGGGALAYDASSSNTDTFTVSLSNSRLTITGGSLPAGKDRARAELILTARNGCGATRVQKPVTLEGVNEAPEIRSPLGSITLASDGYTAAYRLSRHFRVERKPLTYSQAASDTTVVSGSIADGRLTVETRAVTQETTDSIFVMATDPVGLAARDTLVVTVRPNVVPSVIKLISDTTLAAGGTTAKYTLSKHFRDPDGHPLDLTYEAWSSEPDTVSAGIEDSVLTVTTGNVDKPGTATISVSATDPGDLWVSTAFDVTVTQDCAIDTTAISDLSLASGGYKETYTLGNHFTASNCSDDLSYSGSSDEGSVALANVSNSTLTVTSVGTGTADITVTAKSGAVSESIEFRVTVTQNQRPTVTIPFRDIEMTLGGKEFDTGLTGRFSDPEGGSLTFSVEEDNFDVRGDEESPITAEITGNTLTVTPDLIGSATVIVRATDPGRRWVKDEFEVTVAAGKRLNPDSVNVRSAPVPAGSIPDQALTIVGSAVRFDVAPFFMEPDGDAVIYSARLATELERIPDYVSVDMSGSMLTLTPGTTSGRIDVLVSASDIDGTASQTFTVNVAGAN